MVLNIVSFSWSACLIYSTKFQIENRSIPRKDFCLFLRLAVIMGLTWVTGLIAAVVDRPGTVCRSNCDLQNLFHLKAAILLYIVNVRSGNVQHYISKCETRL
jgi:hypothetical protein